MAKNGHWYTDKQGNHYFVEEGQSPKEGWEASKRRKMISGGKYKVSEDGNDYRDVDMDEYNNYEADEDEWDATRDEDIDGFDEDGDIEYNREMQKAQEENAAMSENEPASDKVKIGAKEMTANEWKDWYHNLDDNNREMGREFLLNHASEFNMSENDMEKFLGDNNLDVFNKFYDSIDLASEDNIENNLQYQIQDAFEKGKISEEQYNEIWDKIDKKLGVEGAGSKYEPANTDALYRPDEAENQEELNDGYKIVNEGPNKVRVQHPDGYTHYFATEKAANEYVKSERERDADKKAMQESQGKDNNLPGGKPSSVGNRLKFKLPNQEEQVGTIESLDESGINAFGKKQKLYVVRTPDGRRIEVPGEYVVKPEYSGGMGDYVYDINNPIDYPDKKHNQTKNQKLNYSPEMKKVKNAIKGLTLDSKEERRKLLLQMLDEIDNEE